MLHRFAFAGIFALLASTPLPAADRPNIIVIVSDDQGYNDLSVQGGREIPTPHIDSIASNGVRFTSGYVSGPYCSPTRAGLMTGRYQTRFGHEFNPGPAATTDADVGLPLTQATLADRLKAAGYVTGMVGKWHLGYSSKFHPMQRGFDEFFGFLGGAHSYVNSEEDPDNRILRGVQPVSEPAYLTDALGREAVAFIDRHKTPAKPFFLYWTFNAVHSPLQAPEKYLSRFATITDTRRRTYAAMLSAMDDAVGLALAKLREAGLENNTLIFYVSDNGGPASNGSNNHPLRGQKAQTLEGGIRVPFLVQWKGTLPAGVAYDQPVIQLDIHATALAAAGVAPTPAMNLDGVNLLPYLKGESSGPPHQALYWQFGEQMAIRAGDWKLVRHTDSDGRMELYNLAQDIGEKIDLGSANPAKAAELKAAWEQWHSRNVEPLWKARAKKSTTDPARKKNKNKAD
jgi:arylsulfatase A-like enzyme